MYSAVKPPFLVVEPRYIDRAKLLQLLASLFQPKTYTAEVCGGVGRGVQLRHNLYWWFVGPKREIYHCNTTPFDQGMSSFLWAHSLILVDANIVAQQQLDSCCQDVFDDW